MKIVVDTERCQLHGQCVDIAPDIFWFEGEDLKYDAEPDEGRREAMYEAEEACPEQAITVED